MCRMVFAYILSIKIIEIAGKVDTGTGKSGRGLKISKSDESKDDKKKGGCC